MAPSSSPRADFPIPVVTRVPQMAMEETSFLDSSFIYFPFLPVELRLQIWEIELRRPKFIEAQFSSQIYSPTFTGCCTRGSALLSVCKESRELALSMDEVYRYLTPKQRDFGKRYVLVKSLLRVVTDSHRLQMESNPCYLFADGCRESLGIYPRKRHHLS